MNDNDLVKIQTFLASLPPGGASDEALRDVLRSLGVPVERQTAVTVDADLAALRPPDRSIHAQWLRESERLAMITRDAEALRDQVGAVPSMGTPALDYNAIAIKLRAATYGASRATPRPNDEQEAAMAFRLSEEAAANLRRAFRESYDGVPSYWQPTPEQIAQMQRLAERTQEQIRQNIERDEFYSALLGRAHTLASPVITEPEPAPVAVSAPRRRTIRVK